MFIYISSSWKNRDRVRALAVVLRQAGHDVYDFTDPKCRTSPEIPPEKFPEPFDPDLHLYRDYINVKEWQEAVISNRDALDRSHVVVLLLPCGNDAHSDWAYGVGTGAMSVVSGQPRKGERTPCHLWADMIVDDDSQVPAAIEIIAKDKKRRQSKLRRAAKHFTKRTP